MFRFDHGDNMAMEMLCRVYSREKYIHDITMATKSNGAISLVSHREGAGDDIEFVIHTNIKELKDPVPESLRVALATSGGVASLLIAAALIRVVLSALCFKVAAKELQAPKEAVTTALKVIEGIVAEGVVVVVKIKNPVTQLKIIEL
jgi:hypothetical protein